MTTHPTEPTEPEPMGAAPSAGSEPAGTPGIQVTSEAPLPAVRLLRVAGRLDRAGAATVCRVLDAQLALADAQFRALTDLVVDIGAVASFDPDGVNLLKEAADRAAHHGIRLCLSGCGGRVHLLPLDVRRQLRRLRMFPTPDAALHALTGSQDDR